MSIIIVFHITVPRYKIFETEGITLLKSFTRVNSHETSHSFKVSRFFRYTFFIYKFHQLKLYQYILFLVCVHASMHNVETKLLKKLN